MTIAQIDTAEDLIAWMRRMNLTLTAAAAQLGRKRATISGYVNGLTMLEQGAVSGAVLIEPLSIIRKNQYRTVYRAGDILQPMTTSVGITTREFAKAHPDQLRAIIAGRRAGPPLGQLPAR